MKLLNWKNSIVGIFCALFFLASCNQNPYLATNIVASNQLLGGEVTDSFQIYTQTVLHDSVPAYKLNSMTLGALNNNPTFGKVTSTIYAQFNLPQSSLNFDSSAVIDSVVLCFPYLGTYGDTNSTMDLTVTPIDEASSNKITADKVYYSNNTFALKSTTLASLNNVHVRLKDSVVVYGKKEIPQLRIPIKDAAFIQSLRNQTSAGAFANQEAFHNYFNGIYINVTSSSTNGLMQINPNSTAYSGMKVYYHTPSLDSALVFGINAAGTVNHFLHNYSGSSVQQSVLNSTGNDSVIYLSGLAGVRSKIYIPGLSNLKNVIINKATITVQDANPTYTGFFSPPNNILITRYDASTSLGYTLEDLYEGSPVFGLSSANYYGGIRSTKGTYTFNVARYLQKLVSGTYSNQGFFLEMYNAAERPYQVVLCGGSHSAKKIKLNITYTKIK